MTTMRSNHHWLQFNSHQNQCFEDEEDTPSLCDLPTHDQETETNSNTESPYDPESFEFTSTRQRSPDNMCNADELFFQGQIIPLLHSLSSNSRINQNDQPSMIRSNYAYKPKVRNQFHSHPSPSPQIRTASFRTVSQSKQKTTSLWSFLQVGVAKPQEIGLSDLKTRSKRFGSYNSNSSSSSSMNSSKNQNRNGNEKKNMKKKQRFSGGCKCATDSVEGTVQEAVARKMMRKEENVLQHVRGLMESGERKTVGGGRHSASRRYRTFEWLKQLSVAAPSEA